MNEARDKFLTEAMRECWHERVSTSSQWGTRHFCSICNTTLQAKHQNNNFSTWEGFGKLWEWSTKQDWWKSFKGQLDIYGVPEYRIVIPDVFINPDRFADAVYQFRNEGRVA